MEPTHARNGRPGFVAALGCLALLLAALFARSFHPEYVVFSNDGPLGPTKAFADYGWSNLTGYWQELNWIGAESLPGLPSLAFSAILALGPIYSSKFVAPLSLLFVGVCAWFLFKRLGFAPWVCLLSPLAAALDTTVFSISCWGLSAWSFQRGWAYLALALLAGPQREPRWLQLVLGGFCVGMGVMEGFDVGALFSMYLAAFVVFQACVRPGGAVPKKIVFGLGAVAIVAVCAAFIATHAVVGLVSTQIQGVAGMQQDAHTRQQRWPSATQWSLPKIEALRVIIPGLFGYRMTDPIGNAYPKSYWGAIAEDPALPEVMKALESPNEQVRAQAAQMAGRMMKRHIGSGEYAGVLVVFIAVWAFANTIRRKNNPYSALEKKFIWFWCAAAVISLLLAFGRHAPFYQIVYALPYFSTIRNPIKFGYPLHLALIILFGYGLQGLWRLYVVTNAGKLQSVRAQLKAWWKTAPAFERKWTTGSVIVIAVGLFSWMTYASSKSRLVAHLQSIGFPDQQLAQAMARHSINELALFVLFLALSVGLVAVIMSGAFAGPRARWAGLALGLLLTVDLVRADLPWMVFVNYKQKYATHPVLDVLRDKAHERRVTAQLTPTSGQYFVNDSRNSFPMIYRDWLQTQFQFYRVQSLDIIQMPRTPELDQAFLSNFLPVNPTNFFECGRLWELTNTRYIVGHGPVLEAVLNQRVDGGRNRFRLHTPFEVVPKPGITAPKTFEEITTAVDTNGMFAIYEFTGALPRAKLFSKWQVSTNDAATLQLLKDPAFDPAQTVLVASELPSSAATNTAAHADGTVEITGYAPGNVKLTANAASSSVLLLNDRFDSDWTVRVDGRTAPLLRCNYIMRGVHVPPGQHTVEFRFDPPATTFYVSLAAIITALGLSGFLIATSRRQTAVERPPSAAKSVSRQGAV